MVPMSLCSFALVAAMIMEAAGASASASPPQQLSIRNVPARRSLQASDVNLATCTPVASKNFNIEMINMGSGEPDSRFVEALQKAAARWQKVIVNDLPDFRANTVEDWFGGAFSRPYNGPVDDVVIGYDISQSIDGPGGTLGRAGGTFVRTSRGVATSTISGVMEFDRSDLERMPVDDFLAVALHEIGHVLGLVGVNGGCSSGCDPNTPSEQGVYQCPIAAREFEAWAPEQLVLENSGGMGTACSHWDESVFKAGESSEIMTGFFEANLFQPLSRVTVAALEDIGGYEVDYCGADVWPADENTIKRYEIFKTQNDMDMGTMMEDMGNTMMGMDESGKANPLSPGGDGDSSSAPVLMSLGRLFSVGLASLVLGLFCP